MFYSLDLFRTVFNLTPTVSCYCCPILFGFTNSTIPQNSEELQEMDENIEGLSAQVEYLQESINEHQTDIVEMMDGRENGDTIDLQVNWTNYREDFICKTP